MAVNMYKHEPKVMINTLQGSVATQTVRWANYISPSCKFHLVYMCQKYKNWLAVYKVIAKNIRLTFLAHPVDIIA